MIFLTIAEGRHPDRFEVWEQDQDHGDATRLGWIQPWGTGQIDDLRPTWKIQYADGSWGVVDAETAAAAVEFLRIAGEQQ